MTSIDKLAAGSPIDDYDGERDFAESLNVGYATIRERVANGGPAWKPKKIARSYRSFLSAKAQIAGNSGFDPIWMPDFLFDFQKHLVDWSIRKGRSAIFADCGLGKTPMQLAWAENVVRKTNGRVLILTPLAVSHQTMAEAAKFGIEATRCAGTAIYPGINISNYDKLHYFNSDDFAGCVLDESSILKSFDGVYRKKLTEFLRKMSYRLLCTATAAPNDFIEFGTSSEALGELGYTDMLTRFFKNDQNTIKPMTYRHKGRDFNKLYEGAKWRFKGHGELEFWKWVSSWARAVRRPSDIGFDDADFILPELIEKTHQIEVDKPADGMLFSLPAVGLAEQRDERKRTIVERCEAVASLVSHSKSPAIVWCHLNKEGDILSSIIKGAKQVSGGDSDDRKEEIFTAFARGQLRVLVTKPAIGAWGLNFQHCNHITFFPSHSFEQYYQAVRRCWRFGQKRPVNVDIITTEGEKSVLQNLQRKAVLCDRMFSQIVSHMNDAIHINRNDDNMTRDEEIPTWL